MSLQNLEVQSHSEETKFVRTLFKVFQKFGLHDLQINAPFQMVVQEYVVDNTGKQQINLDNHQHMIIQNTGVQTLMFSKVSGGTYVNWLDAASTIALDWHFQNVLYLKSSGANITIRITTW